MDWLAEEAAAFRVLLSEFGTEVVCDGEQFVALYQAPGEEIFGGAMVNTDHMIQFLRCDAPDLKRDSRVELREIVFAVREPRAEQDSQIWRATLTLAYQ